MKKATLFFLSALVALFLLVPAVGCRQETPAQEQPQRVEGVVEVITIFKSEPPDKPPPGGWTFMTTGPYPDGIKEVCQPGDKIYLGLVFSEEIGGEVTISRITYLDTKTDVEEEAAVPDGFGSFEAGGNCLLGFEDPWPVPQKAGEYELRVYMGDDLIAAILFSVS